VAQTDGGPGSRSNLPGLAPVAQLDRAGGFYPSGCGFDSCRGRQVAGQRGLRGVSTIWRAHCVQQDLSDYPSIKASILEVRAFERSSVACW
jgi:hypothetical protein